MEIITWVATSIAIIGSILNAKKHISGFYFWLVSNAMYALINAYLHIFGQSALYIFNFFVCLMGVVTWTRKK